MNEKIQQSTEEKGELGGLVQVTEWEWEDKLTYIFEDYYVIVGEFNDPIYGRMRDNIVEEMDLERSLKMPEDTDELLYLGMPEHKVADKI